jgi:anti-sigma factor (TIGR02949 family)
MTVDVWFDPGSGGIAPIDIDFDPSDIDQCAVAMGNVQAFLHHELPDVAEDVIRQHLMACENCMDYFDAEEMITALIQRSCPPAEASSGLQARIAAMHVDVAAA